MYNRASAGGPRVVRKPTFRRSTYLVRQYVQPYWSVRIIPGTGRLARTAAVGGVDYGL